MEFVPLHQKPIRNYDEANALFKQYLKREGLRYTKQRALILDAFLETSDHLTAEELYQRVSAKNSKIGFSTVYRTLHVIVECGVAREREFSAGKKYYEHVVGESHHHHHIICTRCNKIVEFQCPDFIEQAQDDVAAEHGFVLVGHTHELFGICESCRTAG